MNDNELNEKLETVTRQRDQWERNAFETLGTIERLTRDLAAITTERDELRAQVALQRIGNHLNNFGDALRARVAQLEDEVYYAALGEDL
jgi:hypothetical protein